MNSASAPQVDGWFKQHPKLTYWGSRGLFAAGTIMFVVMSSWGLHQRWELYLALALFAACSATFVLQQLTLGHDEGGGTPGWLRFAALALVIAGLGVLSVYLFTDYKWDALPLIGLVLLLLGLGWFAEWCRGRNSGAALRWWGAGVLLFTVVATVVVALQLPDAKGGWFVALVVILGVAVFVALPLGLNLLSEWGLRRIRASERTGDGGLFVVGNFVLKRVAEGCDQAGQGRLWGGSVHVARARLCMWATAWTAWWRPLPRCRQSRRIL
ncbi:hypothetical protein [Streptomyces sp. NPDC020681]|uniref:hypothetical protein n=1 Tax=Streptomyces sp. NPDC020681 TaxID=3365083 RepID=UPI0037B404DB